MQAIDGIRSKNSTNSTTNFSTPAVLIKQVQKVYTMSVQAQNLPSKNLLLAPGLFSESDQRLWRLNLASTTKCKDYQMKQNSKEENQKAV